MASITLQTDAAIQALSSVATCTSATSALFKDLLLQRDDTIATSTTTTAPSTKTARSRANTAASTHNNNNINNNRPKPDESLPPKERAKLATRAINVGLKTLSEAARPQSAQNNNSHNNPPATPAKRPAHDGGGDMAVKPAARGALRRSISVPSTPLQPRSLNRMSTSPATPKHARTPSASVVSAATAAAAAAASSPNLAALVECVRVAFAAMRALEASGKITMPPLQLETGMSAFVGRLVGLGMREQAIRELRVLKRRLQGLCGAEQQQQQQQPEQKKKKTAAAAATATMQDIRVTSQSLPDLLDFGSISAAKLSGPVVLLIVGTQVNVLKILCAAKKPSLVEAALPHLRPEHASSPIRLLLDLARDENQEKIDVAKIARQLEILAQCLVALTPSIASKDDDDISTTSNLSPATALELQSLWLECRLRWWKLARHKGGDPERDVLGPLSRCLGAYVRRTSSTSSSSARRMYAFCLAVFERLSALLGETLNSAPTNTTTSSSKSPLGAIYQALTTLAREAGQRTDAVRWATELRALVVDSNQTESAVRRCAVAAHLLALHLRDPAQYLAGRDKGESAPLLEEVLAGIQGPLRGESSELDELLTNVVLVQRLATQLLKNGSGSGSAADEKKKKDKKEEGAYRPSATTEESLAAFALQTPRFCLRWLGKPPPPPQNSNSSTKDHLRHEQRRRVLAKSLPIVMDCALCAVKVRLDARQIAWEALDAVLTECLTLLEYVDDDNDNDPRSETIQDSYPAKISHLYYLAYRDCRTTGSSSSSGSSVDALRILRRSIDCVRNRPRRDRDRAQLPFKLERAAELCQSLGRGADALRYLRLVRAHIVEEEDGGDGGVLSDVADALAGGTAVRVAWGEAGVGGGAETLSRVLCSIARLEETVVGASEAEHEGEGKEGEENWMAGLSDAEQAAVLEHRLHFVLLGSAGSASASSGKKKSQGRPLPLTLEHPTVDALLRIYTPSRFPIRRLRVLLTLLCATIGDPDPQSEVRDAMMQLMASSDSSSSSSSSSITDYGEDARLACFLPHMQAFCSSVTGLLECDNNDNNNDEDDNAKKEENRTRSNKLLTRAISTWRALVAESPTQRDLERVIDDIPSLLRHLESAADFLRMKGRDALLGNVLALAADVARIITEGRQRTAEDLVSCRAHLALQHARLGRAARAEEVFRETQDFIVAVRQGLGQDDAVTVPDEVVARFHLAYAEHLLLTAGGGLAAVAQAEAQLVQAKAALPDSETTSTSTSTSPSGRRKALFAYAAHLHSVAALARGDSHHALVHCRSGVKLMFQDWARLEAQVRAAVTITEAVVTGEKSPDASVDLSTSMTTTTTATTASAQQPKPEPAPISTSGPAFWRLFDPLVRGLAHLSAIYAHLGMYQETLYYAEQAHKLARGTGADAHVARCAAWLASVYGRAARPEKGLPFAEEARGMLASLLAVVSGSGVNDEGGTGEGDEGDAYANAEAACRLSVAYGELGDAEAAAAMIGFAEGAVGEVVEEESCSSATATATATAPIRLESSEMEKEADREKEKEKEKEKKKVALPVRTTRTRRTAAAASASASATVTTTTTTATRTSKKTTSTRTRQTTTTTTAKTTRSRTTKASTKKSTAVVASASASVSVSDSTAGTTVVSPRDARVSKLRASVLVHKAITLLNAKDWTPAMSALVEARELIGSTSVSATVLSMWQFAMATCLVGLGMEQMAKDPVFSDIRDSSISFPAIAQAATITATSASTTTTAITSSPSPSSSSSSSKTSPRSYTENLKEAQELLLQAQATAAVTGDAQLVNRVAGTFQGVALLLSAALAKNNRVPSLGFGFGFSHAALATELARNLTWRREGRLIATEKTAAATEAEGAIVAQWPSSFLANDLSPTTPCRASLDFSPDIDADAARFQADYVDILPPSWTAVSIALSPGQHELVISKLQAGRPPFTVRLPLGRASSRDADSEAFGFAQGRAELAAIVAASDDSCHHRGLDLGARGARQAWWAERAGLDDRLARLLRTIDDVWLGGFRGVFAPVSLQRGQQLLDRFGDAFHAVLDKHLPSRRRCVRRATTAAKRGAKAASVSPTTNSGKITLDTRILELFVGLGDATASDVDAFDEPLTDLLYFVVDVLQFGGERNAFDEIDWDAMVVETYDALHAYHSAVNDSKNKKTEKDAEEGTASPHTILILDRALHVFPWESLPCMQGIATSRVPSLAYLRRLLLEQRGQRHDDNEQDEEEEGEQKTTTKNERYYVSRSSGTYILNPGGDLNATQQTFEGPLAKHLLNNNNTTTNESQEEDSQTQKWTAIIGTPPSEPAFTNALSPSPSPSPSSSNSSNSSSILIYFGHGSGAHYIRSRTIRRLDPGCKAAVLLWGCSSAALQYAGDAGFEAAGPARNYMLAGAPAVVGTLWDVTDRDIDRFAARTIEGWGLVPEGAFSSSAILEGKKGSKSSSGGAGGADGAGGGGKDKKKECAAVQGEKQTGDVSLVEAVTAARDACRFRYLTAAAVVVYGIPVYLSK